MSISKSNNGMAAWLEDFIVAFKNKNEVKAETEVTADINVRDLPKVVWNDETFYVLFDSGKAQVLNQFANVVTTLDNVNTIEEVDSALNSKQVIASDENNEVENMFNEEIAKVSSYLEEIEEEMELTNEVVQSEEIIEEEIIDSVEDNVEETVVENVPSQYDFLKEEIDRLKEEKEKIHNQILEMANQINELVQNYARIDPGNVYDLNVAKEEVKHFEESKIETENQIAFEQSMDLTTPEGRINTVYNEDIVCLVEDVDSYLTEETEIEVVEEEEVVVVEEIVENNEEIVEERVETETETETEVELDEINSEVELNKTNNEEIEMQQEEIEEEKIEELTAEQSDKFRNKICPVCDGSDLVMTASASNMVGIVCKGCPSEFAVDTDSDTIFIKK